MLDSPKLAALIVKAMDEARPRVTNAKLAEACNVTRQAVTGWRGNGRIKKAHLPTVAAITGKPLSYFLAEAHTKEPPSVRNKTKPYVVKDTRLEAIIEAWPAMSDERRQIIYDTAMKHGKKGASDPKIDGSAKSGAAKVVELPRKAKHRG